VDEHLMCTLPGGGQLVGAAIIGHDGGLWASSSAFPAASAEEVEAWMKGLADPDSLAMTGIKLGGEKARSAAGELTGGRYRMRTKNRLAAPPPGLRPDPRLPPQYFSIGGEAGIVIRGKKGAGGLTIKKTVTALVVGVYGEGVSPGDCSVVVENLGDYLSGQGI